MKVRSTVCLVLLGFGLRVAWGQSAATKRVDFDRDIAPIFHASCFSCHNAHNPPAQLRLDSEAAVLRGGVSGAVVIAGNSNGSLLVKRLLGAGDQPRMPMGADPLSPAQIELIKAWIDQASFPAVGSSANLPTIQTVASHPHQSVDAGIYTTRIRPILAARCSQCHGPDVQQKGLRFDSLDSALKGSASGPVIIPGNGDGSPLVRRLEGQDIPAMPYGGPPLAPEEITLIRNWIDGRAPGREATEPILTVRPQKHWAYVTPVSPPLAKVKDAAWCRNPIDYFILARLEKEGLRPSPEANKITLLRRLTFDLTGLPPTPEEIQSFLEDHSPHAYERRVDELLNSPHYGERMAMPWLDLARYGDTHGYNIDAGREMWPWRDWVIKAFNQNMPYDEFTIEQLAGDLLPHATLEQKIASGFNRNHIINSEGGSIPEEFRTEYVVDRVETTSAAWLGLTMGCARCHNHKYDAITQKDFYRFYAFFNNVPEKGLDGNEGNAEPFVQVVTPAQRAELDELDQDIAARKKTLEAPDTTASLAKWQETAFSTVPDAPRDGLMAEYDLDGSLADVSGHFHHGRTVSGDLTFGPGPVGKSAEFDGETQVELSNVAAFERDSRFSISLWVQETTSIKKIAVLQKLSGPAERQGYELWFDDADPIGDLKRGAHLIFRMNHRWPNNSVQIRTKDPLEFGAWHHVAIVYDGSGHAAGIKLYLNGKPAEFQVLRDSLDGSIQNANPLQIGNKDLGPPYQGRIDDLRIYNRELSPAEVHLVAVCYPARAALSGIAGKPSTPQQEMLRDYYLTYDAPPQLLKVYAESKALTARKKTLDKTVPTSMVMQEMDKPRDTYVLGRGEYGNPEEKVAPGVPSILPPLPKGQPLNRLTLAKWLVSGSHPLTSRVAVNRFWQMYFGTGIVKTPLDFGSQGDPPSHPELLDWLATEFVHSGWNVKAMQRLIVTSATYRQSSRISPDGLEKDPENRLLSRGPRFRLPAEMIRDNALEISGLLNSKIGGPSVFPYQPKGLWEAVSTGDVFSAQSYTPSHGPDLYRRSVYTFWKRTLPPPALATFDAPDREKCSGQRLMTNTPLQALVLMNDPTYVEAARMLAERSLEKTGRSDDQRIRFQFSLATGRNPSPEEIRVLRKFAFQQEALYRDHKPQALALLQVGEFPTERKIDPRQLAAWTMVARAILNLDETITKE